jgi:UDP-N-acetylmuramate: L-alanyl-gamma-D-glutamyl-meso-diaminopimelate ligase
MHKNIHFIGIDETVMTGLAMILREQGCVVTGSATNLRADIANQLTHQNILLNQYGFSKDNINSLIECVIIGREVDTDNIELKAAKELGLPIYSYNEYIYEQFAKLKQRIVVIGDSKVTDMVLAMAIYVMKYCERSFDYIANIPQLDTPVRLSDAPIIFLKADTHAISAVDQRMECLFYKPHIVLINGIDTNYCKTDVLLEEYINLLNDLSNTIPKAGSLIYYANIPSIKEEVARDRVDVKCISYQEHAWKQIDNINYLLTAQGKIYIPYYTDKIILQSISATHSLLKEIAITDDKFYKAIADFFVP